MPLGTMDAVMRSGLGLLKRFAGGSSGVVTGVGLDLGSSSVKALAVRSGTHGWTVTGHAEVPLDQASDERQAAAVQEALAALGSSTKQVSIGVSGAWVIMRIVEMPPIAQHELAQALPFEAQRHLPFNLDEVVLDGAILGPAEEGKQWVLIAACKKELLDRRMELMRQLGVEVAVVDVDAIALANSLLSELPEDQAAGTQAIANLGSQWTNVAIFKGRVPYLVRDIPWGSAKLVRDLAEQTALPDAQIQQQLGAAAGGAWPEPLATALRPALEALTSDLQLSFDFFESRFGSAPERLLVTGGLARCAAVAEGLTAHLVQPVARWQAAGLGPEFTVAHGLAVRGASDA